MKLNYTLLTCTLFFIASLTQAQIKKGSILLGGSIQYSNSTGEEIPDIGKNKIRSISIGPAIGYALNDNLVLGLELGYSNGKSNLDVRKYKADGFYGSVFLRQYWNVTSKFYAFANVRAGYGTSEGTLTSDYAFFRAKNETWNVHGSVSPGIAYSVSKNIMLESTFFPLLNVQYSKSTYDRTEYQSSVNTKSEQFLASSSLTNGQTFSLGIRFLL